MNFVQYKMTSFQIYAMNKFKVQWGLTFKIQDSLLQYWRPRGKEYNKKHVVLHMFTRVQLSLPGTYRPKSHWVVTHQLFS